MQLADRIRSAISPTHRLLESTLLSKTMLSSSIPLDVYSHLLSQLGRIHSSLEGALDQHDDLAFIYSEQMVRSTILERDLSRLGASVSPTPLPATIALIDSIDFWSKHLPAHLIGCLYVFEGSRMGSIVLAPRLAKAFQVPCAIGHGLDYHLESGRQQAFLWRQFKQCLNQSNLSSSEKLRVVDGAERTMKCLLDLFECIGRSPH